MQNEANKSSTGNTGRRPNAELDRLREALLSVLLSGNSDSAQTGVEYELRKAALETDGSVRGALLASAASIRHKEVGMKGRQEKEAEAPSGPMPQIYFPKTLSNDEWEAKHAPIFAAMLPKPEESAAQADSSPGQKRGPEYYRELHKRVLRERAAGQES